MLARSILPIYVACGSNTDPSDRRYPQQEETFALILLKIHLLK